VYADASIRISGKPGSKTKKLEVDPAYELFTRFMAYKTFTPEGIYAQAGVRTSKPLPTNRVIPCDNIPCFWSQPSQGLVTRVFVEDWGNSPNDILMSMEGEEYYPQLSEKGVHAALSTTSFQSDIPLSYYSPTDFQIQRPHVPFAQIRKAALFLASNCHSKSGREELVEKLMAHGLQVDCAGKCLNNHPRLPKGRNQSVFVRQYGLYLSFENQQVDDYITEKLWGALDAGVLPVYLGAPNIAAHVPHRSIINVNEFESTAHLANHLTEVLRNESLYESYHSWRYAPLPDSFVTKYNFTITSAECRICRWAHAQRILFSPHAQQSSNRSNKARRSGAGKGGSSTSCTTGNPNSSQGLDVVVSAYCGDAANIAKIRDIVDGQSERYLAKYWLYCKCDQDSTPGVLGGGGGGGGGGASSSLIPLLNVGRDFHTFLHHIVEHYDHLPATSMIFTAASLQNQKREERLNKLVRMRGVGFFCDWAWGEQQLNDVWSDWTMDEYKNVTLEKATPRGFSSWCKKHVRAKDNTFTTRGKRCGNGIFRTTGERLKRRSKSFYEELLDQLAVGKSPEAVHYIERVTEKVFSGN
jgi:hypothetical protein